MEIENSTLQSNSFVRCIVEASLSQRFKNILSCHGLEASINAFVIVFETNFFSGNISKLAIQLLLLSGWKKKNSKWNAFFSYPPVNPR